MSSGLTATHRRAESRCCSLGAWLPASSFRDLSLVLKLTCGTVWRKGKKRKKKKNSSRLLLFSSNLRLAATNRAHRPHRPVALVRPAASAVTMLGGLSLRGAWLPSWSDKKKKNNKKTIRKPDLKLSSKFALLVARLLLWSVYSRVSFLESSSNQLQERAVEKSCCSPARISHTHTRTHTHAHAASPRSSAATMSATSRRSRLSPDLPALHNARICE